MKNKKLKLENLKVQSFVTSIKSNEQQTIKGKDAGGATALCTPSQDCPSFVLGTCQGFEWLPYIDSRFCDLHFDED